MLFKKGTSVKLGYEGTETFPIPARYAGRVGTVEGTYKKGKTTVYQISFGDRRVTPLEVTSRFVRELNM